jgi:hypothetical protein
MDEDCDGWDSACGRAWLLFEGGPKENSYHFCPGCGKPILAKSLEVTAFEERVTS